MSPVPPGFEILELHDGVMDRIAPVHVRLEGNQRIVLGFRIDTHHCNGRGTCHGGIWATIANVLMGLSVGAATGLSGPTVSMTLQYLAPATKGQWVEGRAEILRSTPELGFVECIFTADGTPTLHANAMFQRKFPPHDAIQALIASPEGTGRQAPQ